jgi:hypothetical protein
MPRVTAATCLTPGILSAAVASKLSERGAERGRVLDRREQHAWHAHVRAAALPVTIAAIDAFDGRAEQSKRGDVFQRRRLEHRERARRLPAVHAFAGVRSPCA